MYIKPEPWKNKHFLADSSHVFLAVRVGIRKNALARTSAGVVSAVELQLMYRSHIRDSQVMSKALAACSGLYVLMHIHAKFTGISS